MLETRDMFRLVDASADVLFPLLLKCSDESCVGVIAQAVGDKGCRRSRLPLRGKTERHPLTSQALATR
jgi:hypothetical protein